MLSTHSRYARLYPLLALLLTGCVGHPGASAPPADSTIVGTWRFTKLGEHTISFPFLMEFSSDGHWNSGPTPFALIQRSTYTFDGTKIVIAAEGEEKDLVIANVHIENKTMTIPAEDDGKPITATYERIWPP